MKKRIAGVIASLAVLGGSVVAAAPATAKPHEAPRISQYSQYISAIGGNGGCRGSIHVGIKVDPAKRGNAYITFTPGRFTGNGPSWHRNPRCVIQVRTIVDYVVENPRWYRNVVAGPKGGQQVKMTLRPGSGLHSLGFVGAGLSYGTNNFLIIP